MFCYLVLLCVLAVSLASSAKSQALAQPVLRIEQPTDDSWIRLHTSGPSNAVYLLDASTNFLAWREIALTHDAVTAYPDASWEQHGGRFYRARVRPLTATNDWKNQIHFPNERFLSTQWGGNADEVRWVKFAILLNEPHRVYYQQSRDYVFHYDFAVARLAPFRGMTRPQFDQAALHTANQQVLLGAVLYPPRDRSTEVGIQFVGLDPYPPEMIRRYFDLVRATVVKTPGVRTLYMPAFEQAAATQANLDYFTTNGIVVSSLVSWLSGSQCYSPGWALGRLMYFPPSEIDAAHRDGRLLPTDILLTDGVPAEIPFLAGVISLAPSTPNSHVAILSRSFGVPFVYLAGVDAQMQAHQWVGRRIGLRATDGYEGCDVRLLDLENELTPELEAAILDLKRPPELSIVPKASFGAISAPVDNLVPADIRYFGGKAANFGFLRREIPSNSPVAIALSFDLWDGFLDQIMQGDVSLRTVISNRLSHYTYPPNMAALQNDLESIRALFTDLAVFTSAQEQAVTNALRIFDPTRKIRFRSSTNVEDSEHFTGAGLYDSFSGCLLDDLDGDIIGPSQCDISETRERGVFRAIKKVFASFYNNNAYLERLRFGIDDNHAGMAILVHHSVPDEDELANGVATMERGIIGPFVTFDTDMVTQLGAMPVTNPEGNALPELVSVAGYDRFTYINLIERSSLVPLGGHVLEWDQEYREFGRMFRLVSDAYARHYPGKSSFVLDFEYKKVSPGRLSIKQVRELPLPSTTNTLVPFLLNETNRFCVFQGEFGDAFSIHRLKSFWHFTARNIRMSAVNLGTSLYADATHEFIQNGQVITRSGSPATWDNAAHTLRDDEVTDYWSTGSGAALHDYELTARVRREVRASEPPLQTLADFWMILSVNYATAQPSLDYLGNPVSVTNEIVQLVPCPKVNSESLRQEREVTRGAIAMRTAFYWPEEPRGPVAGYTAPLIQWVETSIVGLTVEPIVLRGEYSQTYRPGHHNFTEEFIFEPRLEPGLAPGILAQLQARNIRLIHVVWGEQNEPITILGLDGKFRTAR